MSCEKNYNTIARKYLSKRFHENYSEEILQKVGADCTFSSDILEKTNPEETLFTILVDVSFEGFVLSTLEIVYTNEMHQRILRPNPKQKDVDNKKYTFVDFHFNDEAIDQSPFDQRVLIFLSKHLLENYFERYKIFADQLYDFIEYYWLPS